MQRTLLQVVQEYLDATSGFYVDSIYDTDEKIESLHQRIDELEYRIENMIIKDSKGYVCTTEIQCSAKYCYTRDSFTRCLYCDECSTFYCYNHYCTHLNEFINKIKRK